MVPSPGRDRTTSASGCRSKSAVSSCCQSIDLGVISAITADLRPSRWRPSPRPGRGGAAVAWPAARLGSRRPVRRYGVVRPPRRSAAAIFVRDSAAPSSGVRCYSQHINRVVAGQLIERSQRSRVELPQRRAQLVRLPPSRPHHRLVRPGQRPSSLRPGRCHQPPPGGCAGRCEPYRPTLWHHQDLISRPRTSAGPGSATSTSGSPRTPVARRHQRSLRTSRGPSRSRSPPHPPHQRRQPTSSWKRAIPSIPSRQPATTETPALLVFQVHIVVGFRPIHPHKDHPAPPSSS